MFQTMCALKIYMRRGDKAQDKRFWRKLFRRPLAAHFIERALRSGITHASLSYGNLGFARGDKLIASDIAEVSFDSLPVCVELVGPRPLLEQFVSEHGKELVGATLVLLEGVHVRANLSEASESGPPLTVEYLQVGKSADMARHESSATSNVPSEIPAPVRHEVFE